MYSFAARMNGNKIICTYAEPTCPAELLDPNLRFAIWEFACSDENCPACQSDKKSDSEKSPLKNAAQKIFGSESIDSCSESKQKFVRTLVKMPWTSRCNLCDRITNLGYKFEFEVEMGFSNEKTHYVACCGDLICVNHVLDMIDSEENEDTRYEKDPYSCNYCGDTDASLFAFYLGFTLLYRCGKTMCVHEYRMEIDEYERQHIN